MKQRFVKTLADFVRSWVTSFGRRVVNVVQGQEDLIRMLVRPAAELSAAIGKLAELSPLRQ